MMKQFRILFVALLAMMSVSPALADIWKDANGVKYELMDNMTARVMAGDDRESDVFPAHEGLTGDILVRETIEGGYTVTEIGQGAFMLNEGITSITIPKTITIIDRAAFAFCTGLTDIYCYADPAKLRWSIIDFYPEGMSDRATRFHVSESYLTRYKNKFSDANVTFVGDLPENEGAGSIVSTFNGWDGGGTYISGQMKTQEGNDWYMNIPQSGLNVYYTFAGPTADEMESCIFIEASSSFEIKAEVTNMFPVSGPVHKIVVRVWGSVRTIEADIIQSGDNNKAQHQTARANVGNNYTDVELYFDNNIEYDDASVKLTICGFSPMNIHSISIVQDGEGGPATSGKWGDLDWKVAKYGSLNLMRDGVVTEVPAYQLTISGNNEMPGYSEAKPWAAFQETITSINVAEGVKNVTYGAFQKIPYLYDLLLPSTVESIAGWVVDNFSTIVNLRLSEGLKSIAEYAFPWCTAIQEVTFPASLTDLSPLAFKGNGIQKLTVAQGNPKYDSRDDCNAVILTAENKLVMGTPKTVVPATVTVIGENAFDNMHKLVDFVVPSNVTTICSAAFNACYNLKTFTIGSGVTAIGLDALKNSEKMEDVYCYANPAALTWEDYDNEKNFQVGKITKFHVVAGTKSAWETKFPSLNATIVDDLEGSVDTPEGDVSGDGTTDAKDVVALMNYIAGITADISATAADVNKDGKVDIADIVALINLIFGK